jgi:hypothetical protein
MEPDWAQNERVGSQRMPSLIRCGRLSSAGPAWRKSRSPRLGITITGGTKIEQERRGRLEFLQSNGVWQLRCHFELQALHKAPRVVRSKAVSGWRRVAGAVRVRRFVASARPIFRLRFGRSRSNLL